MAEKIDYESVGLKVGVEIHRQLDTKTKLFCDCPATMSEGSASLSFLRRLRPTQSELGQVDPAALFEFQKGRSIVYEADQASSCLVEMDEEPPKNLNPDAVDIALAASILMHAEPVDEIHVMRKIVIDGSNTTGFQRTCVVAVNGNITIGSKTIPIQQVSLEEDAARKTSESGLTVHYRIDRLCIPLIEISTGPVISSPDETQSVAGAIGDILRDTGRVKRGLGTIRQDLNVSVRDGALVEIKGVQELNILSKAVECEVMRQLQLVRIRGSLISRGAKDESLTRELIDVSDVFGKTDSKLVREALESGGIVLGVRLPGFQGLLKQELVQGLRLGTEMANRAVFWGRVGGIFHTDELPGYGISEREVAMLRRRLGCNGYDAAAMVADLRGRAEDALTAVVDRAKEALQGVPSETRVAMPDGTSRYMRPRPGASRMYPETDVLPVKISEERLARVRSELPLPRGQVVEQLLKRYSLNNKLANQLVDSEYLRTFEQICAGGGLAPSFVATILTETLKSLAREGVPVGQLAQSSIEDVFVAIRRGTIAKEAAPDVLAWLSKNTHRTVRDATQALRLRMLSEPELIAIVDHVIEANHDLVKKKGNGAYGRIMGLVMNEVRGSADTDTLTRVIKKKISQTK